VFSTSFRRFLKDESGAYAVWSLVWFSIYVAMGGLAVDVTDAYRNQTLLQATADASALAGVMSLPDETAVLAEALAYSTINMDPTNNGNGNVLKAEDVVIGNWSFDTDTFTTGGTAPNAVLAITRRSNANDNPLATSFLRIVNLWGIPGDVWDINTAAVAVKYIPECFLGGNSLVAGNRVDVTSNNTFQNTCVHGQNLIEDPAHDYAVEIQNNGTILDGVDISMSDLDDMIDRPTICSNDGLCQEGRLVEGDIMPSDAFLVDQMVAGMLDPAATDYLSEDMYSVDAETSELELPDYEYIDLSDCDACVAIPPKVEFDPITGEKLPLGRTTTYEYTAVMEPGTVYAISCDDPMDQLILPKPDLQPVLQQVTVISECRIKGQSNMRLEGVSLASSAIGGGSKPFSKATIQFPSGTHFGKQDNCAPGGGVRIYSAASVHITAGATIDGMQIVARGDVELTANETANGITIEAGHNIKFTANADIGTGCLGGIDGVFAWHYRLVR
jgi:Flp pilus assembly protein TadG